jgi:hypothetical protein
MYMNARVAQWVINLIKPEFTPEQLEVIATEWYNYWQGSLSNSEKQDLIDTGHAILWLTNHAPAMLHEQKR